MIKEFSQEPFLRKEKRKPVFLDTGVDTRGGPGKAAHPDSEEASRKWCLASTHFTRTRQCHQSEGDTAVLLRIAKSKNKI